MADLSKLIFCIDSEGLHTTGGFVCYKYTGWIVLPGEEITKLQVVGDDKEEIFSDTFFIERRDVSEKFGYDIVQDKPGFTVVVKNIDSLADRYKKIGLYALHSGEKRLLTEISS